MTFDRRVKRNLSLWGSGFINLSKATRRNQREISVDLEQGGIASFLRDMEIEVGLLDKKSNGQGLLQRQTNQESDVSERLLTVGDSDKEG